MQEIYFCTHTQVYFFDFKSLSLPLPPSLFLSLSLSLSLQACGAHGHLISGYAYLKFKKLKIFLWADSAVIG